MASGFVGRSGAVAELVSILEGDKKGRGRLTIQGISGPGGIGKSMLLDQAYERADISSRNYLELRVSGADGDHGVAGVINSLISPASKNLQGGKPPGSYFPATRRVLSAMEELKSSAVSEISKVSDVSDVSPEVIASWIDIAFDAGEAINEISSETSKWVNVAVLRKYKVPLQNAIPKLASLRAEAPGLMERLGLSDDLAIRNSIRENSSGALSDALMSDLSAIISGYKRSDFFKPSQSKVKGLDRLLVIIDDYEYLSGAVGSFLLKGFLPALAKADFDSVVIALGRDSLSSTHLEFDGGFFDPYQMKQIVVDRLDRNDLDRLLIANGFADKESSELAWRDTEGYPYYVGLWMEERANAGGGAEMLRRFHRRTTRWMNGKQPKWLECALFIDSVNKESLSFVLDDQNEADLAFTWFEKESSVRDVGAGADNFRVRPYLRKRLLDYLRGSDPLRYRELEQRALRSSEAAAN